MINSPRVCGLIKSGWTFHHCIKWNNFNEAYIHAVWATKEIFSTTVYESLHYDHHALSMTLHEAEKQEANEETRVLVTIGSRNDEL
jgi:hypothetical protein